MNRRASFASVSLLVACSVLAVQSTSNADAETSEFDQAISHVSFVDDQSDVSLSFDSDQPANDVMNELDAAGFSWTDADVVGDDLVLEPSDDSGVAPSISSESPSGGVQLLDVPGEGGGAFPVVCNLDYAWSDANGTFGTERSCINSGAPWFFTTSATIRGISTGTIKERGLDWWRNGIKMTRQAPHPSLPVTYKIHGSFPGVAGATVSYNDVVSGRHDIGNGGTFTINFHGYLMYRRAA